MELNLNICFSVIKIFYIKNIYTVQNRINAHKLK